VNCYYSAWNDLHSAWNIPYSRKQNPLGKKCKSAPPAIERPGERNFRRIENECRSTFNYFASRPERLLLSHFPRRTDMKGKQISPDSFIRSTK
jgi:hypothetical protein